MFEKPILRPAKMPLAFIPPMKPRLVDDAPEVDQPPMKTAKRKAATWLKPKIRARVKHLRGEERVRHGTVRELIW